MSASAWWRDVLARAGRQAVQVLTPVLALAAAGDITGLDPLAVAYTVAAAAAVTVLKAAAGFAADPGASIVVQGVERALAAAAGAALAVVPANLAGWLDVDPRVAVASIASSAGLALAAMITNPPAVAPAA